MVLTEAASLHYPVLLLFKVDTHFTPCICCWMPFTYDCNSSVDRWSGWARVGEANSRHLFQSEVLSLIGDLFWKNYVDWIWSFPAYPYFPRKEWRNWFKPNFPFGRKWLVAITWSFRCIHTNSTYLSTPTFCAVAIPNYFLVYTCLKFFSLVDWSMQYNLVYGADGSHWDAWNHYTVCIKNKYISTCITAKRLSVLFPHFPVAFTFFSLIFAMSPALYCSGDSNRCIWTLQTYREL